MLRVIFLAILLTTAAHAVKTIAVLEIVPTGDIELKVSEYRHLTDELRTRAREALPRNSYTVMTRDNILSLMPPDTEEAQCLAESCAVDIGRAIGAEYVAHGFVGEFDGMLTLTVELYESISGNLVGSFVTESDNLRGLLGAVREKAPGLFAHIADAKPSEPLKTFAAKSEPKTEAKTETKTYREYENFSTGTRWGTWLLNGIPGLGSIILMSDWTGAAMQWGLFGGAFLIDDNDISPIFIAGWFVYNIYRSASYDKPNPHGYVVKTENDGYENFGVGRRIGTGLLNYFAPGVGSIALMSDWTGAIVQWVLFGGGVIFILNSVEEKCDDQNSWGYEDCYTDFNGTYLGIGVVSILSNFVFNIARSASYDKPRKTAYNSFGDFNVAVLPNRRGNINAYLLYNKNF
ncbi:MAG: hypothetical protein FWB90_02600 [Fibromonadales bacterium]|nr:hypothetical protein [Fibromonadales bacterium]